MAKKKKSQRSPGDGESGESFGFPTSPNDTCSREMLASRPGDVSKSPADATDATELRETEIAASNSWKSAESSESKRERERENLWPNFLGIAFSLIVRESKLGLVLRSVGWEPSRTSPKRTEEQKEGAWTPLY